MIDIQTKHKWCIRPQFCTFKAILGQGPMWKTAANLPWKCCWDMVKVLKHGLLIPVLFNHTFSKDWDVLSLLWYCWDKWMNGVSGHDSELLRLYWAGDNLGWMRYCWDTRKKCLSIREIHQYSHELKQVTNSTFISSTSLSTTWYTYIIPVCPSAPIPQLYSLPWPVRSIVWSWPQDIWSTALGIGTRLITGFPLSWKKIPM